MQSRDERHQGATAVITPTFLTTARNTWQPAEDNPLAGITLDMRRVLHAEEEFRFHGRVPAAGETLTVTARTGTVTAVGPSDGGRQTVEVDLACTRQTGGVAIAGSATFEV